ncbi:MAG: glucose-6-phosphate 1-epimerase [Thalassolituus sp.]|jgi:glucose-6-phosphate 1-epimerase
MMRISFVFSGSSMSDAQYTSELAECLAPYRFAHASRRGELDGIEINHPTFSAYVLLQGAQLLEFSLNNEAWIWLSEDAEYKTGTSVRGGIPVCWPWFGNADKNPGEVQEYITADTPPAHGFVRTQDWTLQRVDESDDTVILLLGLEVAPSAVWKGAAKVELKITLSTSGLVLSLTTAAGEQPIAISQALHTYFPTDDIHQTRITGYDGLIYTDALDNWESHCQDGDIVFTGETDRIYHNAPLDLKSGAKKESDPVTNTQILNTPSLKLALESTTASAVVWNPWIEKSARLSQFANDAWQRMFCVETANVLDDFASLQPRECFTLTMKLSRL